MKPRSKHRKYCSNNCRIRAWIARQVSREIDIRRKRRQRAEARKLREAAKLNGTRAALPETKKPKAAGVAKAKKSGRGGGRNG